jgi:hypothetical protein
LTLQKSIEQTAPEAMFALFCIDDVTAPFLRSLSLGNAQVFAPDDFETHQLRAIKRIVTPSEYCWTCKSVALLHAFITVPGLDWAVWVDSDMFAFGNPDRALEYYPKAEVLLTPHRFFLPEFVTFEPIVGRLNAGYAAFRNSEGGHAALTWWRDRCFEACSGAPTDQQYGDQKYLESMASLFENVVEADMAGLNCAPWNVLGRSIGGGQTGVQVSNSPVLLYHFQGLKVIRRWLFDLYASVHFRLPSDLRRLIYEPYLAALSNQIGRIASCSDGEFSGIDSEFSGANGFYAAVKRLTWSKNMKLWL